MGELGIDPRETGCADWKWMELCSNAGCGNNVEHLYDSARMSVHKYGVSGNLCQYFRILGTGMGQSV
jgi:hypothetical protein